MTCERNGKEKETNKCCISIAIMELRDQNIDEIQVILVAINALVHKHYIT